MTPKVCVYCGEAIEFFHVPAHHVIAPDHPYRAEYETWGGWWVHAAGPARYLRICAFGPTFEQCMDAYFKYRDKKATPATEAERKTGGRMSEQAALRASCATLSLLTQNRRSA